MELQRLRVFFHRIAFVLGETVRRVLLVKLTHPGVTGGLGQDGGRGDGQALLSPLTMRCWSIVVSFSLRASMSRC